jgi:hypothetical protein
VKRTYTFESISRYAALAMTPVTMAPRQPRVDVEERGDGRWRATQNKERKGHLGHLYCKITKNNDPLSPTSQPQIERELSGVTCSHDVLSGESELRIPRLDLTQLTDHRSTIHAGPLTVLTSFFFFFLKYPLIFFLRTVSNFHNIHQPNARVDRFS